MKRFLHFNQKGQVAVEYILMIVVVVGVGISVFQKIEERFLTGPNSIAGRYLGGFSAVFGEDAGGIRARYKRFQIIK